jgi:hypothetical protein
MKRTKHAEEITERFREMIEEAGDTLSDSHYKELTLLIEAGIDTVLVETLEKMANKLDKLSHTVRHNAEFFD